MERIIVWFRNDLRLHDQEALYKATLRTKEVIPVYCLDPRAFAPNELGLPRTGAFRAKFLLESLADLRQGLRQLGSDLVLRVGQPEEVLPQLQAQVQATAVYTSQEVASEERQVEDRLAAALAKQACRFVTFWQSTLYHIDDLPFPLKSLPDVFTEFRKAVERGTRLRDPFPRPAALAPVSLPSDPWPTLASLGLPEPEAEPRAVLPFAGGETAGLARLQQYFWQQDLLRSYKETRNGLLGADYSSKFSAWLAHGCLSPRLIYDEVKKYEAKRAKNESTYWLVFELLWRDYFRLVAKKFGNRLFQAGGIKGGPALELRQDTRLFDKWARGLTGIPFIDANMIELAQTGFMSNRGRQNVASFLVKDLHIDWRWGAMYFESLLVDYDVCSNWGNWNYVAGVGNDPRENRYFNILRQAKQYDPKGAYVKHWLPALERLPASLVHVVGDLAKPDLDAHGIRLGANYPYPIVRTDKWLLAK
jgi:deoxyribodipyrimidine photo-lyase